MAHHLTLAEETLINFNTMRKWSVKAITLDNCPCLPAGPPWGEADDHGGQSAVHPGAAEWACHWGCSLRAADQTPSGWATLTAGPLWGCGGRGCRTDHTLWKVQLLFGSTRVMLQWILTILTILSTIVIITLLKICIQWWKKCVHCCLIMKLAWLILFYMLIISSFNILNE